MSALSILSEVKRRVGKIIKEGAKMKFTKNYNKLKDSSFTTIHKNTDYYKVGWIYDIMTPSSGFQARVISAIPIKKADIDNKLAMSDADMTEDELIKMLEGRYGKNFDDFVLLRLERS